jgi:hypothetical protein
MFEYAAGGAQQRAKRRGGTDAAGVVFQALRAEAAATVSPNAKTGPSRAWCCPHLRLCLVLSARLESICS